MILTHFCLKALRFSLHERRFSTQFLHCCALTEGSGRSKISEVWELMDTWIVHDCIILAILYQYCMLFYGICILHYCMVLYDICVVLLFHFSAHENATRSCQSLCTHSKTQAAITVDIRRSCMFQCMWATVFRSLVPYLHEQTWIHRKWPEYLIVSAPQKYSTSIATRVWFQKPCRSWHACYATRVLTWWCALHLAGCNGMPQIDFRSWIGAG